MDVRTGFRIKEKAEIFISAFSKKTLGCESPFSLVTNAYDQPIQTEFITRSTCLIALPPKAKVTTAE